MLVSDNAEANYGGSLYSRAGSTGSAETFKRSAGIIKFNTAPINGGLILGATLYLYNYRAEWTDRGTIMAYRMLDGNSGWIAGTLNGSSLLGAVCWAYKAFSATSPTAWAGSAGCNTPGVDIATAPLSGAVTLGNFDWAQGQEVVIPLTIGEARAMYAANDGITLTNTEDSFFDYCASNVSTATYRPKLVVEYTPGAVTVPDVPRTTMMLGE
jgi:hypothetical protein